MKVILLQDVAKVGKRFEVVEVPNGHALNLLIPQRKAQPATPENVKRIEARRTKAAADAGASMDTFTQAAEALSTEPLVIKAETNEQGHMFESLKVASIVAAAKERGVEVAESMVVLAKPIKEVGEHTIGLEYGGEQKDITLVIEKA